MKEIVIVAAGGAFGSALRYLTAMLMLRLTGATFPWGTLIINIVGCFAMGLFIELLARRFGASNELRLLVATGVLGGFTTFSSFSLEVAVLWERGMASAALAYVLASVFGSICALFAGLWLVRVVG